MKHKAVKAILMGVAMLAIGAPQARALSIKIFQGPYQTGSGGEFTVSGQAGQAFSSYYKTTGTDVQNTGNVGNYDLSFQSFCLERSETFSYGTTYEYSVNSAAVAGGTDLGNAVPGSDPISIGTAFLYSQFASGTLAGYNFATAAGRKTSAGELQNAIWCLEDEQTCADWNANTFLKAVLGKYGSQAAAKNASGGEFGVKVLNVYDTGNPNSRHQDLLVQTPEPASMLLLGSGLVGLPFLRRKLARKS